MPSRWLLSLNWVIRLASPKPVMHSSTHDSCRCSGTWLCTNSVLRAGSTPRAMQLRGRGEGVAAELGGVLRQRDRVQVDDAVEGLGRLLQRDPLAERTEVVAEVERARRRLDAGAAHGEGAEARRPSNQPAAAPGPPLLPPGPNGEAGKGEPAQAVGVAAACPARTVVQGGEKASSSSGAPTVTRIPSPANGPGDDAARLQRAPRAPPSAPPSAARRSWPGCRARRSPRSRRAAVSRSRSATTAAIRRRTSSSLASAATAAAWAEHRDAERHVRAADGVGDGRVLRDEVADPQARQAPRLGERPQHGDVRPAAHQLDAVGHVRVGDELAVGLVQHDQGARGHGVEEPLQLGCRRTAVPVGLFGLQTNTSRVSVVDRGGQRLEVVGVGRVRPARPGTSGTGIDRAPATWASSGYISKLRQANAMAVPGSLYAWASCWQSMTAPQPGTTWAGSTPYRAGQRLGQHDGAVVGIAVGLRGRGGQRLHHGRQRRERDLVAGQLHGAGAPPARGRGRPGCAPACRPAATAPPGVR